MNTLKQHIEKKFSRAADSYNGVAKVQKIAIDMTLEVLDQHDLTVRRVLDLGSGTGLARPQLMRRFGSEAYYALDLSHAMLRYSQQQDASKVNAICADIEHLPIMNEAISVMFSTSTLQWCKNLSTLLLDLKRAITPDGLFVFSTFGPNTLIELRHAFAQVDSGQHVQSFPSQQALSSALQEAGFRRICLQSSDCVIQYSHPLQLLRDIKAAGANYHSGGAVGCYGKAKFTRMLGHYPCSDDNPEIFPATYEVIYGCARP